VKSAALEYAERGWLVFACAPHDKTPMTRHGVHDATADINTIQTWWNRTPNANIAIATGPPGPTVIDADGSIGRHEFLKLMKGVGWANTPWCCTGGGGWHIYFSGDPDIRNRTGWLRKVDVRGVGGYVIAPPSTTTGDYWWVLAPSEHEPPTMPAVVRDSLEEAPGGSRPATDTIARSNGRGYGQAALDSELDKVRAATTGTRNHTLNAAAFSLGQLVAGGALERDTVIGALINAGCAAGLGQAEVIRTIASGLRAGMKTPRRR
jgi:hypothetical protein